MDYAVVRTSAQSAVIRNLMSVKSAREGSKPQPPESNEDAREQAYPRGREAVRVSRKS
jgi:hypothetical protein